MQKSDSTQLITVHRRVQPSVTLNRKYVERPQPKSATRRIEINDSKTIISPTPAVKAATPIVKKNPVVIRPTTEATVAAKPVVKPAVKTVTKPTVITKPATASKPAAKAAAPTADKLSPVQLKELAVKKALRAATKEPEPAKHPHKLHFGLGRIVLAFTCTAAAIFALVYFINLNVFDLSIANAAKEAGLEITSSPKVPTGFNLTDIVTEDGKITLNYSNPSIKASFSIVEERSSWDSNALLMNYVKPTYGDDYSIVREQGLTIYISNSDAAWVSGRVVHKITTTSGTLTKKQIRAIAISL